jgi:hypothetical protein
MSLLISSFARVLHRALCLVGLHHYLPIVRLVGEDIETGIGFCCPVCGRSTLTQEDFFNGN